MDIRSQFEAAAGYAVYAFLNQINLLAERDSVRETLKDSPIQLTKGRQLEDIALDDMMERFAFVMRESKEEQAVPKLLFYMLMVKRYGVDISPDEANGELKRMMAEYKSPKRVLKQPVPDFLQVLENAVHMPELAEITNQYNAMFQGIVRLATSDNALSVYDKNMSAQNRMVGVINETIKAKGKSNSGKATNSARGGGYSGGRGSDDDDGDDEGNDLDKLAKRIKALNMPEKIKEEVMALLKTTRRLNPQMSEFNVNCKRLEIIASLPWGIFKEMNGDINKAQEILDDDHYGLDKVKEQIIQHMAVQNRTGQPNGKIMLLVGPPGVGKTSIAQSVAKATGREYIRISLGGVSKESDIRGHSSTFVGAMPGRIIQELKKAKSSNALVVLDEIDKLGSGGTHGDPSAALLEVLDPAQNHTFRDDYLGVEFDLSKVLFFATANEFGNIPGPLRDRMQVLHLSGYTKDEKFEIAQRYLVPKQLKANKLDDAEIAILPETIKAVIKHHTSEAGVRTLEKKIGEICSKTVVDIAKGKEGLTTVTPDNLETFIGVGHGVREKIPAEDSIGIVSGLFYSSAGGGILPIEASLMPSPHGFRMTVSGSLGKVMGESAGVAERLIRARAPEFGIADSKIFRAELSVHCPDGATPKDGPSAGAAFTTAIISAFTGIPIRRDVAMTGEINSKGHVTAIGGLQQKLEGALEAGVKTVLIPKENIPNLREVSEKVRSQLTIIPVGTIEEVLKHALTEEIKPLPAAKEALLGFWPRLRKAWDIAVHGTPSNDNKPEPVRQAAGARRGYDSHTP